jgi:enoyl-CoA hydratase/carnithine racemase
MHHVGGLVGLDGAAIAAACDLRIAAANLKFGFPIARTLGNCLAAANLARLSSLMGAGRVREMIFTARLIEAEEAYACGLISEILPDEAALMDRAAALADHLANMAPLTLRATKARVTASNARFQPSIGSAASRTGRAGL